MYLKKIAFASAVAIMASTAAQACNISARVSVVGNEFPAIQSVGKGAQACKGAEVSTNLTADHQKINVAGMSGNPAEYTSAIIANSSIVALMNNDVIRPLDKLVAKHGKSLKKNQLITIDGKDHLIAEVSLPQFGWTVYLLSPLDARQAEISQGFIFSVVTILVIIFALFLLIYNLLYYFRRDMQPELIIRNTHRLPDRNQLEETYQSLTEQNASLSIIMVDIDHFMDINDQFGRNAGDDVLDKVSGFISSHLREQDVLGRWSSEEFIILLPEMGPREAQELAQTLRHGIAILPPPSDYPEMHLTASFGVSFTASKRNLNELTAHAEDALYQARRDGRNLVRVQLIDD